MIKPIIPIGYSATQNDIDAGLFNTKTGGYIMVVDANGSDTGKRYEVGASGIPPTVMVTEAGGAGWEKVQATTTNYVITRPASGAGLDLHIEAGSLAALTSTAWPVPVNGVGQLRIRNFSGSAKTFTAGVGWTIVTADGNPVTGGSYSIPDDRAVEITLDPDGFAQVVPWGGEVSEATFNTHTGNVSNPHGVTKSQVGLANVDNVADISKPVSTAQQTALNLKQDASTAATDAELTAHTGNVTNPHTVTKAQVGLGSAENTTDLLKVISTPTQTALDAKRGLYSLGHPYATAATTYGYKVTASSEFSADYAGWKAFQQTVSDWAVYGGVAGWLMIEQPYPVILTRCALRGRVTNSEHPTRWKLEGSNDGTTFTTLLDKTAADESLQYSLGEKVFDFVNTVPYKFYRFNYTAWVGNNVGLNVIRWSHQGINILPTADWISYTPVVTSESGGWTNYTATGRYRIVDKMLTVSFRIQFTGTPAAASGMYVGLPSGLTMNASVMTGGAGWDADLVGFGVLGDSGTISGVPAIITTRTNQKIIVKYYSWNGTYLTCPGFGNTTPWTWAVNDTVDGQFTVPIL